MGVAVFNPIDDTFAKTYVGKVPLDQRDSNMFEKKKYLLSVKTEYTMFLLNVNQIFK